MPTLEIDFYSEIKLTQPRKIWGDKPIYATQFSDTLKSFLAEKSQASMVSESDLAAVFEIGYNSCKDFFRAGKTELQYAVARVNRYIKDKNQSLKTQAEFFDYSDIELGLASIDCLKSKLDCQNIFAAEMEDSEEEDSEEEDEDEECECEDSEMDAEKKMCVKCGKKMKAAK